MATGGPLAELTVLVARPMPTAPATPMLPASSDAPAAFRTPLKKRPLIVPPSTFFGC